MRGPAGSDQAQGGMLPSIIIAGSAAFWGLYWIPLRETEELGVSPVWSVALFNMPLIFVSAVVFLWFFKANREILGRVMLAGLLAGAGLALYGMGLMLTTVVRATLLFYLTPVWGTLIGMMIVGERPGVRRWIALTFGVIGLVLTIGLTPADLNLVFGLGEAIGLLSGMVWAVAATVIRSSGGLPSSGLAFFQFAAAGMLTAAFAFILGEGPLTTEMIGYAFNWYLIIGATIMLITIYAIFGVIGMVSPGRSGLLMMTEVVVAVFSAAILIPEEALSFWEWIGAAMIIGAGVIEVTGEEA